MLTQGDDAGCSRSANAAIADAADRGLLRNVSVMAVGPALDDAAAMLASRPELCAGLHGTIHAEWDRVKWQPAASRSRISSLLGDDGEFYASPAEMKSGGFDPLDVLTELQAQLERLRAAGIQPDYFDTHMRFEWTDARLGPLLRAWCASEGLRYYRDAAQDWPEPQAEDEAADQTPAERALLALPRLRPGGAYVLLGHPDLGGEELRRFGSAGYPAEAVARDRRLEHELFLDARLAAALRERDIRVLRYSDLPLGGS
ncbi:ChbG/HpnK family deacetylase [Paenibacillus albicereus]|uniref:ChbG/HpnK family deacetylase n=1 Tax=Paenibacillus albicereus TaxID=2726185 RepID=A0A6H2GVR8_9BACL|nr:ChbG/HpnK family deacetylase [Paenibacillus albicereus]QJC51521.1 ChbG/HpnK family deacetylase [Paenibacillus albicereus]